MMSLEHKFCRLGDALTVTDGVEIEGYASVFGACDQGGDVVEKGAYRASLERMQTKGSAVKMLWQHDPAQPIGVWTDVREDETGLWVKGRLLTDVAKGAEAAALIVAGAIDGLSIGYRTVKGRKDTQGRRVLTELELWEVSLVTFPMLPDARVGAKGDTPHEATLRELAQAFDDARRVLAAGSPEL